MSSALFELAIYATVFNSSHVCLKVFLSHCSKRACSFELLQYSLLSEGMSIGSQIFVHIVSLETCTYIACKSYGEYS